MLFNSLQYGLFLVIVFALYWLLPYRFRIILLLVSSYYFYMSWNAKYVALILFTTLISYGAARLLEKNRKNGKTKRRKADQWVLTLTLIACLGLLGLFKYAEFLWTSLTAIFSRFAIPMHPYTLKLLLPVGISFYTFQTLSYVIDVYRGDCKAEKNILVYAAFVSFFPQLVAGPIERSRNLLPQIREEHHFDYSQAMYGLRLMIWGYFKKMVIADNMAVFADTVFNDVRLYHGFALIMAVFCFTIQIYCDFSGYSDIARGTAKLLGIELMENFRSPYFSTSIHEFWSRWHISLSSWFRDYVYIPMGGNRCSKAKRDRNLLLTFLASGLWHGANWTFVAWGGVHGLAQILENRMGLRRSETKKTCVYRLRVVLVFLFSMLSWVLFRSSDLSDAGYVYSHMLVGITNPKNYLLTDGLFAIGIGTGNMLKLLLLYLAPLSIFDYLSMRTDPIEKSSQWTEGAQFILWFLLALAILLFHKVGEIAFVYFQF